MDVNPEAMGGRPGSRSRAFLIASAKSSLPSRRRLAGYALAVVLAPLLTLVLVILRGQPNLRTDVLTLAVIAVALLGGLGPAVLEAIAGSLLLNFYFTAPRHRFAIAEANNAAALVTFIVVAVVVSLLVDSAARRTRLAAAAIAAAEAARPIAEADRMRAVLLATVSHDLRTPLAAARPRSAACVPVTSSSQRRTTATCWPPPTNPSTCSRTWSPACWI